MKTAKMEVSARTRLIQEAWIGDAVLSLYARAKILREDGDLDGAKCVRMTSNQFLGTIGEPTKVEAELGRLYAQAGLEEAFEWIEQYVVPIFDKQELNRLKKSGVQKVCNLK